MKWWLIFLCCSGRVLVGTPTYRCLEQNTSQIQILKKWRKVIICDLLSGILGGVYGLVSVIRAVFRAFSVLMIWFTLVVH